MAEVKVSTTDNWASAFAGAFQLGQLLFTSLLTLREALVDAFVLLLAVPMLLALLGGWRNWRVGGSGATTLGASLLLAVFWGTSALTETVDPAQRVIAALAVLVSVATMVATLTAAFRLVRPGKRTYAYAVTQVAVLGGGVLWLQLRWSQSEQHGLAFMGQAILVITYALVVMGVGLTVTFLKERWAAEE